MGAVSDAQLVAPVVEAKTGRATLTWATWFTSIVAALNGLLNAFTVGANNAVTIANPAGLAFGGWTSFTPTVSSLSGGVTVNAGAYGSYLRIGQLVQIQIDVNLSLPSAEGTLYLNLPVEAVGATFNPLSCVVANNGNWNSGVGMTQGSVLPILPYTGETFSAGSCRVLINGAYRAA